MGVRVATARGRVRVRVSIRARIRFRIGYHTDERVALTLDTTLMKGSR